MSETATLVARCRYLIEQQIGWGNSKNWQNQDFENLSEIIFSKTGVSLSSTTLKRIWGKVTYKSQPGPATLNALASFLGYDNWRKFASANSYIDQEYIYKEQVGSRLPMKTTLIKRQSVKILLGFVVMLVIFACAYASLVHSKKNRHHDPSLFTFTAEAPKKGIPSSAVFHYDVIAANGDSVFIRQPWLPWQKIPLSKKQGLFKDFYNYPGVYESNLIVGDQIVRKEQVVVRSDGWLITLNQSEDNVNYNRTPVYIPYEEAIKEGFLNLSIAAIKARNISMQPVVPLVSYYNVGNIPEVMNDNFIFETSIKNDFSEGSGICQASQIFILCGEDMFQITLSSFSCEGGWGLRIPGSYLASNEHELNGFGVNLNDWVDLVCRSINGNVIIEANGNKIFEAKMLAKASKILGIAYHFKGTGALRSSTIKTVDNRMVFVDGFK